MGSLNIHAHPDTTRVEADLLKLYEDYNCKYFGGQLPPIQIQVTHTDRREDTSWSGEYDLASGIIRLVSPAEVDDLGLRTTLLHEMVHVAVPEDDGHGPRFRAELQRLAEAGAEDAEYETWRMVNDDAWDDGWTGEESGRWERFREDESPELLAGDPLRGIGPIKATSGND
jgi:SprT-like family protein